MPTENRTGPSLGYSTSSSLENATMVYNSSSFVDRQASAPASVHGTVGTTTQQCSSSTEKSTVIDGMQGLREAIKQRGISGKAAQKSFCAPGLRAHTSNMNHTLRDGQPFVINEKLIPLIPL